MAHFPIQDELAADQDSRLITTIEEDVLFDAFAAFPLIDGRIDWGRLVGEQSFQLNRSSDRFEKLAHDALSEFARAAGIGENDRLLIGGDMPDAPCYEMPLSVARRHFASFVLEPWDTYVLSHGSAWCLMCDAGEEVRFGKKP